MSKSVKCASAAFTIVCLMGAVVFFAGGTVWGTPDAAVVVGLTLAYASVVGVAALVIRLDEIL